LIGLASLGVVLSIKPLRFHSFLFAGNDWEPQLLLKGSDLPAILSITDLDQDGIYEVLVQDGPSFEMQLFDGWIYSQSKNFSIGGEVTKHSRIFPGIVRF
jgi:hypothetical protein